jgi:hypothetical protein
MGAQVAEEALLPLLGGVIAGGQEDTPVLLYRIGQI